ncbi:MAG: hypothetical protein O3B34_04970 [Bacteroidetes bacterium]|jgi:hypothetical protein|nr:hypothetical protein [Bacteroidota bacterium]
MASIKALKKEINYVLGELIEAVYQWESETKNLNSEAGNQIIDQCIEVYDELIDLVNDKEEASLKKDYYNKVRDYLEKKANEIADQINQL